MRIVLDPWLPVMGGEHDTPGGVEPPLARVARRTDEQRRSAKCVGAADTEIHPSHDAPRILVPWYREQVHNWTCFAMESPQPGRVIAGRYKLVGPLARGGMGSVWLARHLALDSPVAVKFMRSSLVDHAEARKRFAREAKAAAQIRSPFVVDVYDHGIDNGTPYIVMEHLEGEDLGTRLRREGPLPLEDVVRIGEQICKGLGPAHDLGIVHRDIKPGNVFLCTRADDMVKVLDFGIAKETGAKPLVESEATTTGQLLGSPLYLSPEHARGQPVDQRTDLWAVAVILFRALTGTRPFDADDMGDLIVRICMDPIPSVAALRPEIDGGIDAFFERALSRDIDHRYPDAEQFSKAFVEAVRGSASEPSETDEIPVGDLAICTTAPVHASGAEAEGPASEPTGGTLGPTLTSPPAGDRRRRLLGTVALVVILAAVWFGGTQLGWLPLGEDASAPAASATESVAVASADGVTGSAAFVDGGRLGPAVDTDGAAAAASASSSASAERADASMPPGRRPYARPRPASSSLPKPLPDIGY